LLSQIAKQLCDQTTVHNKKRVSVTNICCQYFERNIHKTADCREINKLKQQKKAHFEVKAGSGKNILAFLCLFEEINALNSHRKYEKVASIKTSYKES
jgi:hypothetical protein